MTFPYGTAEFLKKSKVSTSALIDLIEICKHIMQDEGIDVSSVTVTHVVDVEEPSLEYIKITFMLHLSFDDSPPLSREILWIPSRIPCRHDFPQTRPFDQGKGCIVYELH
jgi:hypothetical protein